MAETVRLNLVVSSQLQGELERIAKESGSTMSNVFRVAFAIYLRCHKAKQDGLHIGIVADPSKLDTELVGLL
jgi:hypothetical protein